MSICENSLKFLKLIHDIILKSYFDIVCFLVTMFLNSRGIAVVWRGKWQPTPVFLPGESCGRRSLVGCCPLSGELNSWGCVWEDLLNLCFPSSSDGKASACNAGDPGSSLGREDPLEQELATHSCILAWRISRTEEPGRLQSMGSQRVGHNRATNTHTHHCN